MKKLLFAITALALTFTACEKDETDAPITNENPTVKFTVVEGFVSGNATVENGSAITIGVEATSYGSTKLKTLSVTRTFTGVTVEDVDTQSDINEVFAGYVFTGNAATTAGIEIWTATVVDKDNKTSTATLILTTNDGFTSEEVGAFFHVYGANLGAYDLVNNVQIALTGDAASKDMANFDGDNQVFTGKWTGEGAGTMFVKVNATSVDYNTVVYSSLATTYEANVANASFKVGDAASSQTPVTVGDLFIAKLRGGTDYALIKVTMNDPLNDECDCSDKGKLTFDYKK
jgi:hypothetical protein